MQQRRTAAATPTRRQAAEEEPGTAFDAAGPESDDEQNDAEAEDGELPEVIDLSGVKAASYTLVPRGTYRGWVESVDYGLSQSKGLPMLTWTLKFMFDDGSEDENGQPVGEKERTLRWYTTLAGEGAGRTKASLAALDPELDLANLKPDELDEHFADMAVKIRVTIRPDRDDPKTKRNNVADVTPDDEVDE